MGPHLRMRLDLARPSFDWRASWIDRCCRQQKNYSTQARKPARMVLNSLRLYPAVRSTQEAPSVGLRVAVQCEGDHRDNRIRETVASTR